MLKIRRVVFLVVPLAAVLSARCATVAQVDNLTEAPCSTEFEQSLSSILSAQGEKPEVAQDLAHRTYIVLTRTERGPRPFFVSSPSGTDYTFFIQKKGDRCLLRLYGRQKGFMSYTNNLTYIATRQLTACTCRE
jgi:hypothetical protein